MDLSPILDLLPQSLRSPIAVLVAAATSIGAWWVGGRLSWRKDAREDADAIFAQMSKMLADTAAERGRLATTCADLASQVETLRAGRFALLEFVMQLQDGLIAARALLHEAERALGRPETVFPPLPPMPVSTLGARDPPRG